MPENSSAFGSEGISEQFTLPHTESEPWFMVSIE